MAITKAQLVVKATEIIETLQGHIKLTSNDIESDLDTMDCRTTKNPETYLGFIESRLSMMGYQTEKAKHGIKKLQESLKESLKESCDV